MAHNEIDSNEDTIMARKKKKSKSSNLKRRQQKQQRRSARQQRRPDRRGVYDSPSSAWNLPSTAPMISPELLADFGSGDLMAVVEVAADTDKFLEEPEYAEIELEPIMAVGTFISTAEEMGYTPDSIGNSKQMQEVLAEVIPVLITADVREELVQATETLRERLRTANAMADLRKATALQILLQAEELTPALIATGLIRKFVSDALDTGFTVMGISMQAEELDADDEDLSFSELQDRILNSPLGQSIQKQVEESPGLLRYMEKQIDEMYDAGNKALFKGELMLNLYSETELTEAAALVQALIPEMETDTEDEEDDKDENTFIEAAIQEIDAYVQRLFTPERLVAAREHLLTLLNSPEYKGSKWASFLQMQYQAFDDENALNTERPFLLMTMWGELHPFLVEDDAEADDSATEDAEERAET